MGRRDISNKKSAFRQYNTDSDDDDETLSTSSKSSSFYSYGTDSLMDDDVPRLEPSEASAPLSAESHLESPTVDFVQRVGLARKRRARRDARIAATSPSVAKLTYLEALSVVFVGWAAVCCIVSGHPPLVVILLLCLCFPMKVVAPILEDTERHMDMGANDERRLDAASVRSLNEEAEWDDDAPCGDGEDGLEGRGGEARKRGVTDAALLSPSEVKHQPIVKSQEKKHDKFLKAKFREKRDEKVHGAKASLAGAGGDGDSDHERDGAGSDAGTDDVFNDHYAVEPRSQEHHDDEEMHTYPNNDNSDEDAPHYEGRPAAKVPLTSENLRQLTARQVHASTVNSPDAFVEDSAMGNGAAVNRNKSLPTPRDDERAKDRKSVRFAEPKNRRAPPKRHPEGNAGDATVLVLDKESAIDPELLMDLKKKMHRKRKLTFGETNVINGNVGPNTFFIVRRMQVLLVVAYCVLYFIALLVVASAYSSGGSFEENYNEAQYRFERSRMFYALIPFLEYNRNVTNAEIIAANSNQSLIPAGDTTVYSTFQPDFYLMFSLFVSQLRSVELTVSLILIIILLLLAIILLGSLPRRVRYYDHQDERQRYEEGFLNYVNDPLHSTLREDLGQSVLMESREVHAQGTQASVAGILGAGDCATTSSQGASPIRTTVAATGAGAPIASLLPLAGDLPKTSGQIHQEQYVRYWTDADMQVATSVLTVNSFTDILAKRLREAESKGGSIGEYRFGYTPLHANRSIRVTQLCCLLATLLTIVAILPSLMVCVPAVLILLITITAAYMAPPSLSTVGIPYSLELVPGEDRPRSIRFPYYNWHADRDVGTKIRSYLTITLYYTTCLVFAAYVGFQNPMLEGFNTMPEALPESLRMSGSNVQQDYYHRVGLYNLRTFLYPPMSVEGYQYALDQHNISAATTAAPASYSGASSFLASVDIDNGLGIPNADSLAARIILQLIFLYVAIVIARSLPSSLFIVMLPEYDEDGAFSRQVTRLKNAQRSLIRKVRRLERTEEAPSLEMPPFDPAGYVPSSAAGCRDSMGFSPSPDRASVAPHLEATPSGKNNNRKKGDAEDDSRVDPLKNLDDSAKEAAKKASGSSTAELYAQKALSFMRASLALLYSILFKYSPFMLPPAYAVYCCVSPSLVTAGAVFPLVAIFCFSGRKRQLIIAKMLLFIEILYLSALVAVFSLELHKEDIYVLRWILIGSRAIERSLNLSTCNFILGIHSICLVLLVSSILVFVSANATVNEDDKGPRLGVSPDEKIQGRANLTASEKALVLRKYAVELENRSRNDKATGEKVRAQQALKRVAPGHIVSTATVQQHLAADEKIGAMITMNRTASSSMNRKPLKEVSAYVRERGEHYRRKWRVQALVEANNILGSNLVKHITALYECRYDEDCHDAHKRLLEVHAVSSRRMKDRYASEVLEVLRANIADDCTQLDRFDVSEVTQEVSNDLLRRMVDESLQMPAGNAVPQQDDAEAFGFNNTTASANATFGLPPKFATSPPHASHMDAKQWAAFICTLDVKGDGAEEGCDAAEAHSRRHIIDMDHYVSATSYYCDDFEAIRCNVLPHVAWTLTSAELLVIHRYVQYYCPAPRFQYVPQGGVQVCPPKAPITDTAEGRPIPTDGNPFVETPMNLDDLILICACFKAGGRFLEKAHVFGGEDESPGAHRDAVLAVMDEDDEFCNREMLAAGGPIRAVRDAITARMVALERGANEGRGDGVDFNDTMQYNPHLRTAMAEANDGEEGGESALPVDPALQAAARHINFCLQHRVLQAFPTPDEREELRKLQNETRRAIRMLKRERAKALQACLRGTMDAGAEGFDTNTSVFGGTDGGAAAAALLAQAQRNQKAMAAAGITTSANDDADEEEVTESLWGAIRRHVRGWIAEVYMWVRRKGASVSTLCQRLLISTYFIVAVVGFSVAGYRNYFTFLHFALMFVLVMVLWSQVFNISRQIYFINLYVLFTAVTIIAIIVMTCLSQELMYEWPSSDVLGRPIPGTGNNREPLLVSIGVQGFQRTPWELLLYFLQLFVLVVQRWEYYRFRKSLYARAQLLHVSLPEEVPSFDDEDDIDIRFERSCEENRWNDAASHQEDDDGGGNPIAEVLANERLAQAEADGEEAVILTTRGIEGDTVSVEAKYLVGDNSWTNIKAWVEWRLLMTSSVFIRLQMYVAVIVGTPVFVAIEGFNSPNYWTMFFLVFFICLLTYSIKSNAFESRMLYCLWMWALVLSTLATLSTAAFQSDPLQSFVRMKFEELLAEGRFVGQYCAKIYTDGSTVTTSNGVLTANSTPQEVVNYCLEEIGYTSALRDRPCFGGFAHYAVILVISVVEYALLSRYYTFRVNHPLSLREGAAAETVAAERLARIQHLRGLGDVDVPPTPGEDDEEMESTSQNGKDGDGHGSKLAAEPPSSLGFMNTLAGVILMIVRDNCEKLHWAMCIVSALHVRSLTHAVYVLFFVFGTTGWLPLVYSALHILCVYFYPISLFGEYWTAKDMMWVGVAKDTPSNTFHDKVDLLVGPILVFLASLLYLNTVGFSHLEHRSILARVTAMEERLKAEAALTTNTKEEASDANDGHSGMRQRIADRKSRNNTYTSMGNNSGGASPPRPPPHAACGPMDLEDERAAKKAFWNGLQEKCWGFVLFIYHDITLTMGYELLVLGLLIFMAVNSIRVMSCFFFLSFTVMLLMGRERVITSKLFLMGSHVFYCIAVVVLQWLYIGQPYEGGGLGDINTTYQEAIDSTGGSVRYDYLKYLGVHPDAALVWTTAITAFLFRLVYSQIPFIEGGNFPAAVIAVPNVIVKEKSRAAGTLVVGTSTSDDGPINMVFGSTTEVIAYFDAAIVSHRIAKKPLTFLQPLGLITGEMARDEAEAAARIRAIQAQAAKRRKKGSALSTPTEKNDPANHVPVTVTTKDDAPPEALGMGKDGKDFYNGPFTTNQRRLLLDMLTHRDSSVRHRSEQELIFTYLSNPHDLLGGPSDAALGGDGGLDGSHGPSRASLDATLRHHCAIRRGMHNKGFRVTSAMAALALKVRTAYEHPDTIADGLVWLMMCVFITPVAVFADAICGGSLLHVLICIIAVYMMVRRRVLYWHPQPVWDRFLAFYVVVLLAQMVCQIPTVAKLIEENIGTPKALGFGGYYISGSYYNDGTAPAEPAMPLTALRVIAIFLCVLQKRIFSSFSFLFHLIEVHNKGILAETEHARIQQHQLDTEKSNEQEVSSREALRGEELKKVRQEMRTVSMPNAAVVDMAHPVAGEEGGHPAAKASAATEPIAGDAAVRPHIGDHPNKEGAGSSSPPPNHGSKGDGGDGAEGAGRDKRPKEKKKPKRMIDTVIVAINRHSYMERPIDPSLPTLARLLIALSNAAVRYFSFIVTVLIAINFIVSGSLADFVPFIVMACAGVVWRPWAPRVVYVVLLYYVGIALPIKMVIRFMADAMGVNDGQARVLSAFFLNMPPTDLDGIRPRDLNRVSRGNVVIQDLVFDFIVLIALQLHLHIADRVGIYAAEADNDVKDKDLDDGNDSDMTQYSTDEDDELLFDESARADVRAREHHLHYAVRERMKVQRDTFGIIMKMDRPHASDFDAIRAMREEDRAHVAVLRERQALTLERGRPNLTEWDLRAGSKGISTAAAATLEARDRSLASVSLTEGDVLLEPSGKMGQLAAGFIAGLRNISGFGIDLYTVTFFWEIITLIVTIFVYPELAGRNTGSIIQAVEDNLLPGPLLAILLIFTLIMVIDRILYTYSARNAPKANFMKWLYLVCLTIGYCVCYIYWLNEICARAPLGGPFVMAMKAIYLILSGVQVYFGFPLFRHHDPFTKRTGLSATGWSILLAIPFMWDLRMYLDWCFTRTSLGLEDYVKVEEVHTEVYNRYCNAEGQADKKGTDQSWKDRCCAAGLWFIVIMLIVFFPLMYFSGFNPRLEANPITNVEVSLRLDGFGALYRSERFVPEEAPGPAKAIQQMYPALDLNDYFVDRLYQYVEADTCSGDVWGLSPQGIDAILAKDPSDFALNLDVAMTRTNAVASDLRVSSIATVNLDAAQGQAFQNLIQYSLDVPSNPALLNNPPPAAQLKGVYDPFIRNSPSNVEPFSESSDFPPYIIDCELNIRVSETSISGTPQWVRTWCLTCRSLFEGGNDPTSAGYSGSDKECVTTFKGCEAYDYADPNSASSQARPMNINGMYFNVASDEVPQRLSLIPSDTGIIALYATFILALAGVIRERLSGAIHRVVLEECQDPLTLGIYVRYIWMSRGGGRADRGYDLILEEDLYLELIDLIRSPDELFRRTKRRQECYDELGDRVDLSKMPKW